MSIRARALLAAALFAAPAVAQDRPPPAGPTRFSTDLSHVDHLAASRDGRWLAASCDDGQVRIIPLDGAGDVRAIAAGERGVTKIAFADDSGLLATWSGESPNLGRQKDPLVRVWDVASGQLARTYDFLPKESTRLGDIPKTLTSVAPWGGDRFVVGRAHGPVATFGGRSTALPRDLGGELASVPCDQIAPAPDGNRVVVVGGGLTCYWIVRGAKQWTSSAPLRVSSVAWSADGDHIAGCGILAVDETAKRVRRTAHLGVLRGSTGSARWFVRLGDATDADQPAVGRSAVAVRVLRDLGSAIRFADVATGALLAPGDSIPAFARSVCATSDGSAFWVGAEGGTIHRVEPVAATPRVPDGAKSWSLGAVPTALAASPDGRHLAVGTLDGSVFVLPSGGGAPRVLDACAGPVTDVMFAGGGMLVSIAELTRGTAEGIIERNTARVQSIDDGMEIRRIDLCPATAGSAQQARKRAWRDERPRLLPVGGPRFVVARSSCADRFDAASDAWVADAAFPGGAQIDALSPDGSLALSTSGFTLAVAALGSATPLWTVGDGLQGADGVSYADAAFSPDGGTVVAVGRRGTAEDRTNAEGEFRVEAFDVRSGAQKWVAPIERDRMQSAIVVGRDWCAVVHEGFKGERAPRTCTTLSLADGKPIAFALPKDTIELITPTGDGVGLWVVTRQGVLVRADRLALPKPVSPPTPK